MLKRMIAETSLATAELDRRDALRLGLGVGAGLIIGFHGASARAATEGAPSASAVPFTAFVQIRPDDTVTVFNKHLEMGQGNATGLATLIAEELDARHDQMRVEHAPANTALYKNLFFGLQGTGGSTAIANSFMQYREAGAAARGLLIRAAAERWGVAPDAVTIREGALVHGDKTLRFGDVAEAAAKLTPAGAPVLKTPDAFRYIGKAFPRVDTPLKTAGAPGAFGIDLNLPDMLVAVMARPPKFGATPATLKDDEARAVPGVVDIVRTPHGVAVLAEKTWPAIRARDLLTVTWDESGAETRGSDTIIAEYRALADEPGTTFRQDGDADAALKAADSVVEAEYVFPYLAHATMEPFNITIQIREGEAEMWLGSQFQTVDQGVAAGLLQLPPEKVTVNTLIAGGSFGRRAVPGSPFVGEAIAIAQAAGTTRPVKLLWTREDDMRGGWYRPAYVHKVAAGVKDGRISGWRHRIVGQSIVTGTPFEDFMVKDGVDATSVEGLADHVYAIADFQGEVHNTKTGVPPLWWRAVGHTHTAYAMETMIEQLAVKTDMDPVAFRRGLVPAGDRRRAVLDKAAAMADWAGPKTADGRFRGVALHKSFSTYVAEIAEIRLDDSGRLKVEQVWCAVDCGIAVNPDNIRAQIEGGVGYGLGAILRNALTLSDGVVEEGNFDTYEPLRITDMPKIHVEIIASDAAPTGVGEPGTPPIGPAVANAVFHATGAMPTILPLARQGLV